jgi:hypothetical protein
MYVDEIFYKYIDAIRDLDCFRNSYPDFFTDDIYKIKRKEIQEIYKEPLLNIFENMDMPINEEKDIKAESINIIYG